MLLTPVAATMTRAEVDGKDGKILETLRKLHDEGSWGEVILERGGTRDIKVLSIQGDTVAVQEVVGALHERPAVYTVAEFRSLRELGRYRISQRRAVYTPRKSVTTALLLELVLPGGGYFYSGENRQGVALLLFSGVAVATGLATGKDGAAGWVPLAVWTKIASLLHLRDEVSAGNRFQEELAASHSADAHLMAQRQDRVLGGSRASIATLRYAF
jgi:hypothetical protein